jgi:hypothetical protein
MARKRGTAPVVSREAKQTAAGQHGTDVSTDSAHVLYVETHPSSYAREISTPPRPVRQRKQPTRQEGLTRGAKAKNAREAKGLRTPAVPREAKQSIKSSLDAKIHAYVGQDWRYQLEHWAKQYSPRATPGTATSLYALAKAALEWLDDHGSKTVRYGLNAFALLVDPEVQALRKELESQGFVLFEHKDRDGKREMVWGHAKGFESELTKLERKLSRWGSELKGSTAEGKLLKRTGLAWWVWTNDVESRDAARKKIDARAKRALARLSELENGTDKELMHVLSAFPELKTVLQKKAPIDRPLHELLGMIISQTSPE